MRGDHRGKEEKEEIEQRGKLVVEDCFAKRVPYGGIRSVCCRRGRCLGYEL